MERYFSLDSIKYNFKCAQARYLFKFCTCVLITISIVVAVLKQKKPLSNRSSRNMRRAIDRKLVKHLQDTIYR